MNRDNENFKNLGKKTIYKDTYSPDVLETFENQHTDNDYLVKFICPEFTAICPITGQPDFAEIRINYIPNKRMVESKSLKLYLFSFRNHGSFHSENSLFDYFDGESIFLINFQNETLYQFSLSKCSYHLVYSLLYYYNVFGIIAFFS
ncbi:MAG: preQ(1) synthase, partial [Bacteroidales bacterium]